MILFSFDSNRLEGFLRPLVFIMNNKPERPCKIFSQCEFWKETFKCPGIETLYKRIVEHSTNLPAPGVSFTLGLKFNVIIFYTSLTRTHRADAVKLLHLYPMYRSYRIAKALHAHEYSIVLHGADITIVVNGRCS